MFNTIYSLFGWNEDPVPSPPSVTITGVRIPADGTPAHLLSLTTTSDPNSGTDGFLFHTPDVRRYWTLEQAWRRRDIQRIDLHTYHPQPYYLQPYYLHQKDHLRRLLRSMYTHSPLQLLHLRQRYFLDQQHHILQPHQSSCAGTYYVFYSFDVDTLSENKFVPDWLKDTDNGDHLTYYGDVFLVKMAPQEYGENEWAVYEDIISDFLNLLGKGPM
jgi:hypothetical protein